MAVPPQVPVVKFVSPSKADQGLLEFHNTSVASYVPLDLGASHPNTREFLGFRLGKQFNLPNDEKWVIRVWVKDQVDSTWWNWAEKFSSDANAYPIFIREYREPRKTYAPLTKGQPLKSVYKLALATAGAGYSPDTLPALTFDNTATGGTGAAGHAVVNPDGTIAHLVLDDGGDSYASAPLFTIEAPPEGGTTATGTAVIQPATALLVAEEAQQFPQDSEFFGLYLNVVRVYETLPGPTIPYTRFDDDLGPVQGTRQAVLWANQAAGLTATGKTTYEARDGSSIVAWKIVEAWSDGTGGAGNPAYPSWQWTEFERDGVKKVVTRQLKPIAQIVTTETLVDGELTRKFSERFNEFLAFQITETITVLDADLLDLPSFTTSIPNLIPEIFRAEIPTHVESHIIEGTAEETALALGEFEHTERQLTPLYKEVRSTILDDIGALPITVTGMKETNQNKQVVTVAMKLDVDSITPTAPTALIDVDFKKLGNGLAIEITKTIPSVFDATVFQKQRGDSVPERFKKATPESTEKHVATGTAAAPSLASGDTAKSEGQLDAFTKETRVTNRTVAGGYPDLEGQTYDESLDVEIPYVESVDPAGTNIGTAGTDVTPLGIDVHGNDVELAKTIDTTALAAALDAYMLTFPGTANINFPDELLGIDAVWEKSTGDGDYDEAGSAIATNSGYSMSQRGSGQASTAIIPSVIITTRRKWGSHLPTKHYFFYLPSPVTEADIIARIGAVSSWPDWNPESNTIVCTGQRLSLRCDATVQRSEYNNGDGNSSETDSEGDGASREVGSTVNTISIPNTIHGIVAVSGLVSDTETADATADASFDGFTATRAEMGTVTGTINPIDLAATTGDTTIPTGTFLLDTHCEPAGRLNYVRCHAETVDL